MSLVIYKTTTGFFVRFDGAAGNKLHNFLVSSGLINNETEILDVSRFEEWICQSLCSNDGDIEELTLSNEFTANNFKLLKEALSKTTHLKKLVFSSSAWTTNNAHLYEGIASNTSIVELKATLDRAVRPTGSDFSDWKQLSEALALNKSIKMFTLEEVSYAGIHTTVEFDTNATLDFFNFLTSNNTLTAIFTDCLFSADEMKSLGEGLKHNRFLTDLGIKGVPIIFGRARDPRVHRIAALEECLKYNTTLKMIHLDSINVESESLQLFLDALEVSSVESLSLTQITIIGSVDPLFHFLKSTKTLRKFSVMKDIISTNPTYDDLLQSLYVNTSITSLDLNWMTHSVQLGDLLRNNKTLKSLTVGGRISPEVRQALEEAVRNNDTLTHLEVFSFEKMLYGPILKQNKTLRSLVIHHTTTDDLLEILSSANNIHKLVVFNADLNNEETSATVKKALESNYTLTHVEITRVKNSNEFSQRNYELMKQRYEDTTMIIHVITRSHLFDHLPREIWHSIFSYITYPGLGSFEPHVMSIFNSYGKK